jgi:hypothetical protein
MRFRKSEETTSANIDHFFRRTVFRLASNLDERRFGIEDEREATPRVRLIRRDFPVRVAEEMRGEGECGGWLLVERGTFCCRMTYSN